MALFISLSVLSVKLALLRVLSYLVKAVKARNGLSSSRCLFLMQKVVNNLRNLSLIDCWADTSLHLQLLKSSMLRVFA